MLGNLLNKFIGQAHFTAPIGAQLGIQNQVKTHVHKGHQSQHGKRRLALSGGIAGAEMLSKCGGVRSAQKRTIDGEHLQALPGIVLIAFAAPVVACLAKQPLNRVSTQSFAGLGDTASGRQIERGQALGADVQAPGDLMDWHVAKQGHAQHQPEYLIVRQTPPPDGGLGG